MQSLNDSGIEPGHGQDRDLIDRGLAAAFVLFAALAVASFAVSFAALAIGQPVFWGHDLLDHSDTVPIFWGFSAIATGAVRQKRRQTAMRAKNHPDPLEMPAWAHAWFVVMTVLFGLDAYTRLRGSTWLDVCEMTVGVLGLIAIAIGLQRRRRVQGIRASAHRKILWALMVVIAVVGLLVQVLLALRMQ